MSSVAPLELSPRTGFVSDVPGAAPCRRVRHHPDPGLPETGHRSRTISALAERLVPLAGNDPHATYLVPDATLLSGEAQALGVTGDHDLFGGVVAECVLAGKAITHPIPPSDETRPSGWSDAFCTAVRSHALPGLSVFSRQAAAATGAHLLTEGPVRLKPGWTDGGRGQSIADSEGALAAAVDALDADRLACCGLVMERNLQESVTFSVGRFHVGDHALAYVGTQSVTRDNAGGTAYGGSRLRVVKGGFAALAASRLSSALRRMVAHARAYDEAADRHLEGFFASRRNYDVVLGRDAAGQMLSGVLESSWRIGGASGAEIAALNAFAEDPEMTAVVASCHEIFGRTAEPPKEADVYYADDDPEVGYLTKYALVESRSHA